MRCSPRSSAILAGLVVAGAGLLLLWGYAAENQSARKARNRFRCINNLKLIAIALYNYNDAHGHLPGNIVDKDGRPLLSWRVAILPHIEEKALYNEFKLDEPWDSLHNKPLLDRMPKFLQCPSRPRDDPTESHYLGFVGPRTLFEPGAKIQFEDVLDGTSNTLAVVEAEEGTPWTKPADLPFDESAPPSLYGAGSDHSGGFNALFADGSVRFLKATISPSTFKALITRNGGEPIGPDPY